MKVVIFSRKYESRNLNYIQELADLLYAHQVESTVYEPFMQQMGNAVNWKGNPATFTEHMDVDWPGIDFVVTMGGDGTILKAITEIRDSCVPIVGINLGRLGFLAAIEKSRIAEAINSLMNGSYTLETRSLLQLDSDNNLFGETPFALNDFTLLKRDTSSMITVHVHINGEYLNTYWCDGIILATPTGSTGYSLSCGGPVIFPNSGNFIITPVAPHNLNIRPIVIPDDAVVSFSVEGRTDNFLCTLDSRFATVHAGDNLNVRKCDFGVQLVKLPGQSFGKTIRDKMAWGTDKRNY